MRILQVCDENTLTGSGVLAAVQGYLAGLHQARSAWALSLALPAGGEPPAWPGIAVHALPSCAAMRFWRSGWGLRARLEALTSASDLIHVHSIWMAPEILAARLSAGAGRPWLATMHGMVQPLEFARKRWKKAVYWRHVAAPILRRATVLHAITAAERAVLHALLPTRRIEVIPNGLDLVLADAEGAALPAAADEHCILFFGRVAAGKGVDRLIGAFAAAALPVDRRLDIVGPCLPAYRAQLEALAAQTGMAQRVRFLGPVRGPEKWRRLKQAWLAVMPSVSEVVGMANLEAAAAGVPTLVGPGAGLDGWMEAGGLVVAPQVPALADALCQASRWSAAERDQRGRGLRQLVEQRYSSAVVGQQLAALYQDLVHS